MPDVVNQRSDELGSGPDAEGRRGLPPLAKRVLIAVAVITALSLASRSGLLSADEPTPTPSSPTPTTTHRPQDPTKVVARLGDELVIAGPDGLRKVAKLPAHLAPDALEVAPVGESTPDDPAELGPVLFASGGTLFRADPTRGGRRVLGTPTAVAGVIDATRDPGRALVQLSDDSLAFIDSNTGAILEPDPIPGFAAHDWIPEGLLVTRGTNALVMSRSQGAGSGRSDSIELALAWPAIDVQTGTAAAVQMLGTFGALVGITGQAVLTLPERCPESPCPIRAVSVPGPVVERDFAPPEGFNFAVARGVRVDQILVPIAPEGEPGRPRSLARLVPGGERALLVQGTQGVNVAAGLVDGPGDSVYLVTDAAAGLGSGEQQVRRWDPDRPNRASLVARLAPIPQGARLVCGCG